MVSPEKPIFCTCSALRVSALIDIQPLLEVTSVRCSIVVSISACHAEDPGSISGGGGFVSIERRL